MKIALTITESELKHQYYVNWLREAGKHIKVVTLSAAEDNLHELLSCDALVLSGGIDVHPDLYGKTKRYKNAPAKFDKRRDIFETAAYTLAQEKGLPVLAICRGMQLVNCIEGGSLQQDLGKQGNERHRAQHLLDKAHGASVHAGTMLYEIFQSDRAIINSAHHQAIKKPGKGLRVSCTADDGTIEALERKKADGKPFLLCVQWHPERMYKFQLASSPASKAIRDRLLEAIKKTAKQK